MLNPNCIDCPIQKAYSEYVIQSNLGKVPDDIDDVGLDLTFRDHGVLRSMIAGDQAPNIFKPPLRPVPTEGECKGPRRRFHVGRLSCGAEVEFVRDERYEQ
jgi:hypothetical protein